MLIKLKDLFGYRLQATDGQIGKVSDFYFDDIYWTLRYMIADTGSWLVSRQVLISPVAIGKPEWEEKIFHIKLSKKQIGESPEISADEPVSRQKEIRLLGYYNWPIYWGGVGGTYLPGSPEVSSEAFVKAELENRRKREQKGDPHLRSIDEVSGYHIKATDGDIGHVEDFIFDPHSWIIRYLEIDTQNWIPGSKKVLVSTKWVKDMDWEASRVYVDVNVERIKTVPAYDESVPVSSEYEEQLHRHYQKER